MAQQATNLAIQKMITIDNTGMPKPPDVRQIQDKDVLSLFSRDQSHDKKRYMAECGVIYYMGDPKSPVRQRGLSDRECLKEAIENYNLPKDYTPDLLVTRLISKYYVNNITEAGVTLEALQRSIHLASVGATRLNELLSKELESVVTREDVAAILNLIDNVSKRIVEIPNLTKALGIAYENLRNESESETGRGGRDVLSSMDADEDD